MDEFTFIRRHFADLSVAGEAFGLRDDAAVLTPPMGQQIIATTDPMIENVHFLADDPFEAVACKALRRNLSDLNAMGATPWRYLLSAIWRPPMDDERAAAFVKGLHADQERYGVRLAGGDTAAHDGPHIFTVSALGLAPHTVLRRSGARPGDDVWVSGSIGDAWLGLQIRLGAAARTEVKDADALISCSMTPEPPIGLGPALVGVATAAIDISDGLAADARHCAEASHVALEIDVEAAPLSQAVRHWVDAQPDRTEALAALLTGGDDYQLLFTAPKSKADQVFEIAGKCGVAVSRIGEAVIGEGARIRGLPDKRLGAGGHRHF